MSTGNRQPIEFCLLGPVEALRDGESFALGGPRQRALLALLVLEPGRPVSVDHLAEELWHGRPPAGAAITVRSYVSRLRSSLGAAAPIDAATAGYVLHVAPESIDAHRFERLVREGKEALGQRAPRQAAERLRAALALWRGPAFGGTGDPQALRVEAGRLDELRLLALEDRIQAELDAGADAEVVPELEALVRAHPYRERFWRHLMLALYRAGRQAEALAAYHQAHDRMDRELGVEPSPQLRQLEQAILLHQVPMVQAPEQRHELPAPVSEFIGREDQLAELDAFLAQKRLVTLTGVAGVGKTRLGIEAARRAERRMRDGTVLVDFGAVDQAPEVPGHVARSLGLRHPKGRGTANPLAAALHEAEVLLVFDNCEHVREPVASFARSALARFPRLRILATSREVLGVPGEVDYVVPALSTAAAGTAGDARQPEAVRLFLARARDAGARVAVDEETLATAARICRDLDGLPLAIELAAARAHVLSLAQIAERLADRFRFLVSGRRAVGGRHRTLQEAMDWSFELLTPDEQRLLARLSVFADGFTLDTAAAVCLDVDGAEALQLVERLADASLVVAEEQGGTMRYRLLQTVRHYAAERLTAFGDTQELRRRHAEYVLALAEEAEQELRRSVQSTWGERLHVEYADVMAALSWSVESDDIELGLRIAAALARFWIERDYASDADRWLGLLLARGAGADPVVQAKAALAAWNVASVRGDAERADRHARHALELCRSCPGGPNTGWALLAVGALHEQRGEYEDGWNRLQEALALHRAAGDEPAIRRSLQLLGNIARECGQPDEARRLLREALALARAQHDAFHEAGLLHSLGDAELVADKLEAAECAYLDALGIARRIDAHRTACYCLAGLGAVATARGDYSAGAELGSAASLLERKLGFRMRATARRRYATVLPDGDARGPQVTGESIEALIASSVRARSLRQP